MMTRQSRWFENRGEHTISGSNNSLRVVLAEGTRTCPAFTLIELLVVMAIIAVLMLIVVPSVNTILRGSQLTQGGQVMSDQLSFARQQAILKNHAVEVRFYQYSDPELPGEQEAYPNTGKYRAIQSFEILDSGSAVALGKIQRLSGQIIMDSGSTLSSIIGTATKAGQPAFVDSATPQSVAIPRSNLQYNSVSFRFRPDGSVNLSPNNQWFVTLHNSTDGDQLAKLPANFTTIQVEAINGYVHAFRP